MAQTTNKNLHLYIDYHKVLDSRRDELQIELEKPYGAYRIYVVNCQISFEKETQRSKQLRNALENIGEALQNRTSLPSLDEEDDR